MDTLLGWLWMPTFSLNRCSKFLVSLLPGKSSLLLWLQYHSYSIMLLGARSGTLTQPHTYWWKLPWSHNSCILQICKISITWMISRFALIRYLHLRMFESPLQKPLSASLATHRAFPESSCVSTCPRALFSNENPYNKFAPWALSSPLMSVVLPTPKVPSRQAFFSIFVLQSYWLCFNT